MVERLDFRLGQNMGLIDFTKRVTSIACGGSPKGVVVVPQSSWSVFNIRLRVTNHPILLTVPGVFFFQFRIQELFYIFLQNIFMDGVVELFISASVAKEKPSFDHRGFDGQVLPGKFYAVFNRTGAVADFHVESPKNRKRILNESFSERLWFCGKKKQQVDI